MFQVDEEKRAVCRLSSSSALDCDRLSSLHLKYTHLAIYSILKVLFNKMMESGIVPDNSCASIITPTVKNVSNSLYDVNKYRSVSIISVLIKTFELLVDLPYGHLFHFHDNQFGFCDGGVCNKANFVFTYTIRYFRNRYCNIY